MEDEDLSIPELKAKIQALQGLISTVSDPAQAKLNRQYITQLQAQLGVKESLARTITIYWILRQTRSQSKTNDRSIRKS